MANLAQILTQYQTLLVLDAASQVVQVGWLARDAAPRWVAVEEEAGSGLFRALDQLGVQPGEAGAFGFCEGPGSILGIRTAAVALATWNALRERPLFAYRSLELLAATVAPRPSTVIADARRQTWHALAIDDEGQTGEIERRPTEALPSNLAMPEKFRAWTPLPTTPITMLTYDLTVLWAHPAALTAELWRATAEPEAFHHEAAAYVQWTPGIHRAPTPSAP